MPDGSSPETEGSPSDTGTSESDEDEVDPPEDKTPEKYEEPFRALGIPLGRDNQNWVARQNLDFANCYGSGKVSVLVPKWSAPHELTMK